MMEKMRAAAGKLLAVVDANTAAMNVVKAKHPRLRSGEWSAKSPMPGSRADGKRKSILVRYTTSRGVRAWHVPGLGTDDPLIKEIK